MNQSFFHGYILGITKVASYDVYNEMWIKQALDPGALASKRRKGETGSAFAADMSEPARNWFNSLTPQQQTAVERMLKSKGPGQGQTWGEEILGKNQAQSQPQMPQSQTLNIKPTQQQQEVVKRMMDFIGPRQTSGWYKGLFPPKGTQQPKGQ